MSNGADTKRNRGILTPEQLRQWDEELASDPAARLAMNAVTRTAIDEVALDRERLLNVPLSMSHRLDNWEASDQKRSGRCWLFAALNLLRSDARKKLNVKNFEFSQNHAMYWDKIERANYFLEDMIGLAETAPDDRVTMFLLGNVLDDGGQWNMEVAVFEKHGVVPKALMPETESSSNTSRMNDSLRTLLRKGARLLREAVAAGQTEAEVTALKQSILRDAHRVLTIHLGVPPQNFEWRWNDDDTFHEGGNFTPQSFLAEFTDITLSDYVCLIDDPRAEHPKGRGYTVAHLGNVVGGDPVLYLNTDTDTMKRLAAETIVAGEPVWFGCDVDPQMESKQGVWSANLIDYSAVYGVDLATTKEDRVRYGDSAMTHAMLFTGVDLVDSTPRRWRVENSWGIEKFDKGFCTMDDSWFDEYVFEVVVHKDRLPAELREALTATPTALDPWDPMGALA
ncbi:C1 family peptidase [Leucobacter viscericola]|uniref:Aminopeptidase n=1 Tax=Leucobacter viscericola TaxID=2714935 RepID=A0A6G7XE92_9MICO|nr:C1 family peptidase [Leucobacter viscericola]QIK62717.1 C1 family peptidase [Leucobacter viscericola]